MLTQVKIDIFIALWPEKYKSILQKWPLRKENVLHFEITIRWGAKNFFWVSVIYAVFLPPYHIQHCSFSVLCLWKLQIQCQEAKNDFQKEEPSVLCQLQLVTLTINAYIFFSILHLIFALLIFIMINVSWVILKKSLSEFELKVGIEYHSADCRIISKLILPKLISQNWFPKLEHFYWLITKSV